MNNKINKITTNTETKKIPKVVGGKLSYSLYDKEGNNVGHTFVDPGTDMSTPEDLFFTKEKEGLWKVSDVPETNITLDQETGNIKITAPKSVTDTDQFKDFINEDQLKLYSRAYKTNKDYKISVTEKNDQTGENETKEMTIPEYVERLNSSLTKYFENLRDQRAYARSIVSSYGNKAKNLALLIAIANSL